MHLIFLLSRTRVSDVLRPARSSHSDGQTDAVCTWKKPFRLENCVQT